MLTITLMNDEFHLNKNIQVNAEQKMIDTLVIMQEAGIIQGVDLEHVRLKSIRRGRYININENYEHEQINNGDVLELI